MTDKEREAYVKKNVEYWKILLAGYRSEFSRSGFKRHFNETLEEAMPIMLRYQEQGNEWWLRKDAKMAIYQLQTSILMVRNEDFLNELSKLVGRDVTNADVADNNIRAQLLATAKQNYRAENIY